MRKQGEKIENKILKLGNENVKLTIHQKDGSFLVNILDDNNEIVVQVESADKEAAIFDALSKYRASGQLN